MSNSIAGGAHKSSNEMIELCFNRHLRQMPRDGMGPGKITSHPIPPGGHFGKEPGQRELPRQENKNDNKLKL